MTVFIGFLLCMPERRVIRMIRNMNALLIKAYFPAGKYRITAPVNSSTTGYYSLPLIPDAANSMCGRSAFMIHGDSRRDPGTASQGCIVMRPGDRRAIWLSHDHELIVL